MQLTQRTKKKKSNSSQNTSTIIVTLLVIDFRCVVHVTLVDWIFFFIFERLEISDGSNYLKIPSNAEHNTNNAALL